jgi:hypothetical protein
MDYMVQSTSTLLCNCFNPEFRQDLKPKLDGKSIMFWLQENTVVNGQMCSILWFGPNVCKEGSQQWKIRTVITSEIMLRVFLFLGIRIHDSLSFDWKLHTFCTYQVFL